MVRLTKIYTKFGDQGRTMLGDGSTTAKHSLRVDSYGTVDEANAAIGVAAACITQSTTPDSKPTTALPFIQTVHAELVRIQNDLFDVGADLCVPVEPNEDPTKKLRTIPSQTLRLEHAIDRYNQPLAPLNSFILPGGTPLAAHLHLARTITRRAERLVSHLLETEPDRTNKEALVYLNRLSDLLFVLARAVNQQEQPTEPGGATGGDILWKPGQNR